MYLVYYFDTPKSEAQIVHSSADNKLLEATLTKSQNQSDSFSFKVYPNHYLWNKGQQMVSQFQIIDDKNGKEVFFGRLIKVTDNYQESSLVSREFTVASGLDYLNDSRMVYKQLKNFTAKKLLQEIITQHNSQVEEEKKFTVGKVDIADYTTTRFTGQQDSAFSALDALIDSSGGEVIYRRDGKKNYIDWQKDAGIERNQAIDVNTNQNSMTHIVDPADVITVLYPTGAPIENNNQVDGDPGQNVNIGSANKNKQYIENADLIKKFGRISGTKAFSTQKTAAGLLKEAKSWFDKYSGLVESYSIEAIDLANINIDVDTFNLLDYYRVTNKYFGIDSYLKLVGLKIDLNDATKSQITVGDKQTTLANYLKQQLSYQRGLNNFGGQPVVEYIDVSMTYVGADYPVIQSYVYDTDTVLDTALNFPTTEFEKVHSVNNKIVYTTNAVISLSLNDLNEIYDGFLPDMDSVVYSTDKTTAYIKDSSSNTWISLNYLKGTF